ncbi:MAG: DinB family protein [Chloroflexi bacterium]|nr:DinB family protein [Chloroflexota bacterium]
MDPLTEYRVKLLSRAESLVPDFAEAVAAIPALRWQRPLRAGALSPHQLMAHVRELESRAYGTRLKRILEEDCPLLQPFILADWRADEYRASEPLEDILRDFARRRESLLSRLRALSPEQWSQVGRHPAYGVRTVQWWSERLVSHNEAHLAELRAGARRRT